MPRPRRDLGTYGTINAVEVEPGKWRARARYRFNDGKLRQVERFAGTENKATQALRKALNTIDAGRGGQISPTMTLRTLADRFLEAKRQENRSRGTIETYQYTADKHLKGIGDLTIAEATPERLQTFLSGVHEKHGHGAAKNCRSVLSGMMQLAVVNGAIDRNPVRQLSRIEKHGKPGSPALPLEQLSAFLRAIHGDKQLADRGTDNLLEFMAYTGFRVGEACGLAWADVDLGAGNTTMRAIAVHRRGVGTVRQEYGKTDAAARTIALPEQCLRLLHRLQDARIPETGPLVFPTPLGAIRDPSNVEGEWRRRRDDLGFPGITSHSLRKMVATALDVQGMSARDIADYLGHKNPSVTEDVYMQRNTGSVKAAAAMQNALSTLNESAG
jgi:integrase